MEFVIRGPQRTIYWTCAKPGELIYSESVDSGTEDSKLPFFPGPLRKISCTNTMQEKDTKQIPHLFLILWLCLFTPWHVCIKHRTDRHLSYKTGIANIRFANGKAKTLATAYTTANDSKLPFKN